MMCLLAAVLAVAGVIDLRTSKVPNWLVYPAIAFGLLGWTLAGLSDGGGPGMIQGLLRSAGPM